MPCGPMLEFEDDARRFWRARAIGNYAGPELRSPAWLALLFSCLAFGNCFADPSSKDTQLNANVFGRSATDADGPTILTTSTDLFGLVSVLCFSAPAARQLSPAAQGRTRTRALHTRRVPPRSSQPRCVLVTVGYDTELGCPSLKLF